MIIGELSLDGTVRHTNGVLSMAMQAQHAGLKRLFVPANDAPETVSHFRNSSLSIESLFGLYAHLQGMQPIAPLQAGLRFLAGMAAGSYGTEFQKCAGKNMSSALSRLPPQADTTHPSSGPPAVGKTLLARVPFHRFSRGLTLAEALEVTRVYSVADMLPNDMPLLRSRPFRAPHHISHTGLVGGGRWPCPGEISLANRGVLFLTSYLNLMRGSLEAMRQPLEGERTVSISRAPRLTDIPREFPFTCGDEPMSLRLSRPSHKRMHLRARTDSALPEKDFGTAPRSHRYSYHRTARRV